MSDSALPELYFRIRENGAQVFRVDTESRNRRIEMDQIAVVNIRNGEIKPHGEREITDDERAGIDAWVAERKETLRARDLDDARRMVDRLNLTALWMQQRATPEEIDEVADALLLAMHDLRGVIVRKKSDKLKSETD
ncbi:hypothetical protein GQ651_13065 [Alphaproteobacteria bacterium GH1-50]|uniref:Uncharacterized protein n=1 Tax=Kangsaoukella pontilimi TaxID=2691042 RepID=A0A7C9J4G0_9RHOB|nr:hypothetical protein [Kangsaoukella pontilimi]MXQ08781.1 hypothetical protein [Kangsaoukella pontilimi]